MNLKNVNNETWKSWNSENKIFENREDEIEKRKKRNSECWNRENRIAEFVKMKSKNVKAKLEKVIIEKKTELPKLENWKSTKWNLKPKKA